MEQCKLTEVNERIREAAQQAAAVERLCRCQLSNTFCGLEMRRGTEPTPAVLLLAQFKEDRGLHAGGQSHLRTLLHLLASLLPAEAQSAPQVAPDMIRRDASSRW